MTVQKTILNFKRPSTLIFLTFRIRSWPSILRIVNFHIFSLSSLNQIQNSSFRNNTELHTNDNFKWFSTRQRSMDRICPRDPRFPMPLCSQSCEFDIVSANSKFLKIFWNILAISRIRRSIIATKFDEDLMTTIQIIHRPKKLPSVMVFSHIKWILYQETLAVILKLLCLPTSIFLASLQGMPLWTLTFPVFLS